MITGKTKITGIFGYPVEHTLSPYMHNEAFKALGLDYCYLPFRVSPEDLNTAVASLRALNIKGVNITIPHKESIIPFLDELDKEAGLIGAVNTVLNKNGRLIGYNTDGKGFARALREDAGVSPKGKRILIIGAGGAARAIAFALAIEGVKKIFINDIVSKKAEDLSSAVTEKTSTQAIYVKDSKEVIGKFDILINATPLGMQKGDPLPVCSELLSPGLLVYDIVYNPAQTRLLKKARDVKAKAIPGIGMLIYQAALSFKIWTGYEPPIDVMKKAVKKRT